MKINGFEATETDRGASVSARLRWEDSDGPDATLYFTSPRIDVERLIERPEAFVLAAFPLALWRGERRVVADGVLCPRFHEGVALAIEQMRHWHPHLEAMEVEPAGGFAPSTPPRERHAGMMLSGGIDSMSLLRRNRLQYPATHPGSIRTGFFAFGLNSFDFEDGVALPERRAAVARYGDRLGAFARSQGVDLHFVETNIRGLYPDFETWGAVGWGMGTVAAGLAAAEGLSDLWVASNGQGLEIRPRTAHLDLAPWVSPAALDFRVGERVATRVEETGLVADWTGAGDVVRSCLWLEIPEPPRINCGVCEKCVRTMLTLVALGRSGAMAAFPSEGLTAAHVDGVADSVSRDNFSTYPPLPALLRSVGRDDLARAVEALIQGVPPDPAPSAPGLWRRLFGSSD